MLCDDRPVFTLGDQEAEQIIADSEQVVEVLTYGLPALRRREAHFRAVSCLRGVRRRRARACTGQACKSGCQ
jgi:hypothetical protein